MTLCYDIDFSRESIFIMFLKGDPSNQTSAPHSYGTSLPMVESELKYNEFRKKQEKQRNWDYNVLLKVVRLKLLWVVLLDVVPSLKVTGSGPIDFYDH